MAFHLSAEDIPLTPKEPPAPSDEEAVSEELPFGEPPDHVKVRQDHHHSMVNPKPLNPAPNPGQPVPSSGVDISSLLRVIQSQSQQQPQVQPVFNTQPAHPATTPMANLEQTVNMFRQQQQSQQLHQIAPSLIPQTPPAPPPPPSQKVDFEQIVSIFNAQKQMQQLAKSHPQPQSHLQPALAPVPVPVPVPASVPPQSQPPPTQNLAAYISQLTNPNRQPTPDHLQDQVQGAHGNSGHKRTRNSGLGDEKPSKRSKKGNGEPKDHKVCRERNESVLLFPSLLTVLKKKKFRRCPANTIRRASVSEARLAHSVMILSTESRA